MKKLFISRFITIFYLISIFLLYLLKKINYNYTWKLLIPGIIMGIILLNYSKSK